MQFETYRQLKGWSLDTAAAEMRVPGDPDLDGVNGSMISRHERGVFLPSPELVARYEAITDGAVTYSDWVSLRHEAKSMPDGRLPVRPRGRRSKEAPAPT